MSLPHFRSTRTVHPARATIQPSISSIPFLLLNLGRPACYSPPCLSQQILACLPLLAPFTLSPEGSFEGSLDRPFSFLPGRFRPGRKGPDSKPPPSPDSRLLAYYSPPAVRDWNLQNLMPVTYLDATLTSPLASVENKGLTENLKPLDATLTKNIGGRGVLWLTRRERSSIHSIHRDPAHQLGIKVRRFLRHHFAGSGDFHHLLDVAGVQQERNLRAPAVHGVQRGARLPLIRQVGFRRHRLRRAAQRRLQDSFVQQHHVQFALQRRNVRQQHREVDPFAQRQHVESALLRLRRRVSADR